MGGEGSFTNKTGLAMFRYKDSEVDMQIDIYPILWHCPTLFIKKASGNQTASLLSSYGSDIESQFSRLLNHMAQKVVVEIFPEFLTLWN